MASPFSYGFRQSPPLPFANDLIIRMEPIGAVSANRLYRQNQTLSTK